VERENKGMRGKKERKRGKKGTRKPGYRLGVNLQAL